MRRGCTSNCFGQLLDPAQRMHVLNTASLCFPLFYGLGLGFDSSPSAGQLRRDGVP